ncbi:MAG: hypothetical protein ACRDI1_03745 [Actinomycetota bacterium]
MANEHGVAMVTVLLVGAVMTVTASAASFAVVQDLRAGRDDQKAAGALAYAEAGADRMLLEIRSGNVNWGQLRLAGCEGIVTSGTAPLRIQGAIGEGEYDTTLAVDPVSQCSATPSPKESRQFAITSAGSHPAAERLIRQLITIKPKGLPIGIYADGVDGNGSASMNNLSLISPNNITGRDKIAFAGRDPYYTINDFYPGWDATGSEHIPAAAHAVGELTLSTGSPSTRTEHKAPGLNPNCTANPDGQSLWDGSKWGAPISSGCSGQPIAGGSIAYPPTTLFNSNDLERVTPSPALTDQDYLNLKESAKTSGLYCYIPISGSASCLKEGSPVGYKAVWQSSDVPTGQYITYFDFEGGDPYSNTVKWKADVSPCSDDPDLHKSTTLIVRNGSLSMQSGAVVTGAVILPEGRFDSEGSFTTHGTIIAKDFWLRGSATFMLSECWIRNMPTIFLDITPSKWTEVDR